jgi:choline dehydrogenase
MNLNRCAEATESMGIPITADINSPDAPAVASVRASITVDQDGYRCSTADAFLPASLAIQRSKNLKICTKTVVTSLDIETAPGGTLKASGIYFQKVNSGATKVYHARARREIILCAGAIGTPQLLMLRCASSIGTQHCLREDAAASVPKITFMRWEFRSRKAYLEWEIT